VRPHITIPPINRDTLKDMPVPNGAHFRGDLYLALKSEEIGISRFPLKG
jgi:hypothetical protein